MRSFAVATFLSILWFTLFLSVGIFTGWVTVSTSVPWLFNPAAFVFKHLRLSVVPFGILFVLYCFLVDRIRLLVLANDNGLLAEISFYDRLLNTVIAAFFGVGVIWTAIGMEGALMQALKSTAGLAGELGRGPEELLERLVNGGLLLALSTTIFGGACGYIFRILKVVLIGREWDRLLLQGEQTDA